jgi:hypothetical protein
VTGFDNVKLSEFCYPALTTVHIPREQIGHIICESLMSKSGQWTAAEAGIVIDPELVLRDSTGPAPPGEPAANQANGKGDTLVEGTRRPAARGCAPAR